MADVRHAEVQGIRPERRVREGGSYGGIIQEGLLLHHGKLSVSAYAKVRSTKSDHRVVGDVCELVNDKPGAGHLLGPLLHAGLRPEGFVVFMSNGVSCDLVSEPVRLLDCRVVAVFVGNKEGCFDIAVVGILSASVEDLLVQVDVVVVDGVVESDRDHLRNVVAFLVVRTEISRNTSSVFGAEAVRQFADGVVAQRRPIGIGVGVASVFVGSVVAVGHSVAEQTGLDAVSVSAGEMIFLANRFVGGQKRFHFFFLWPIDRSWSPSASNHKSVFPDQMRALEGSGWLVALPPYIG